MLNLEIAFDPVKSQRQDSAQDLNTLATRTSINLTMLPWAIINENSMGTALMWLEMRLLLVWTRVDQ